MSNLYFEAQLDADKLHKQLRLTNQKIDQWSANFEKQGAKMDSVVRGVGASIAAYLTFDAAKGLVSDVINVRGEFQQLDIALTTMLGNKAKADKLMQEVVTAAAKTPYSLTEIGVGAKQLIAFQVPANEVIDTLTRLGNVASGVSAPISEVIHIYGKVKAKGKMQAEELNQLAEKGIPIIHELAKALGTTDDRIYKMAETGAIGFSELQTVIKKMTDEGGQFFNLMEENAKSLPGMISNLGDAWDRMLNDIGTDNQKILEDSIKGAMHLVEHYKDVAKVLGLVIATYGSYKAALLLVAAAQRAQATAGAVQAWLSLARGIKTAKDAQIAFNLATKANPMGLLLAGVTAVVTALVLFSEKTKETKDIIADLDKTSENFAKTGDNVSSLAIEYEKLSGKAEKTSEENERLDTVMKELAKNVPDAVTQFDEYGKVLDINISKVKEFSDAQKDAVKIQLDNQIKEAEERKKLIEKELKELQNMYQGGVKKVTTTQFSGGFSRSVTKEYKASQEEINKAAADANKLYAEQQELVNKITKAKDTLAGLSFKHESDDDSEEDIKIFQDIDVEIGSTKVKIQALKNEIEKLRSGDVESENLTKDISKAEKSLKEAKSKLKTLTGQKEKKETKKDQTDKLNALKALGEKEQELLRDIEYGKLAIMNEGNEKQKKAAELAHKDRIFAIQEEEQGYINTLNKSKGLEYGDKGYVTELPEDIQKGFNQKKTQSENQYQNELQSINKASADKIQAIWDEASNRFIHGIEAEKKAVNEKYNTFVKQAQEAGATKQRIDELNAMRAKEITQIENDAALKMSDYYKQVFGDIERYGYQTVKRLKDQSDSVLSSATETKVDGQSMMIVDIPAINAQGEAVSKQVTLTIDEFTRLQEKYNELSSSFEQKNPFAGVKNNFQDLTKAFSSGDSDGISNALSGFNSSMSGSMDTINQWGDSLGSIFGDQVGEDVAFMTDLAGGVTDVGTGVAKFASGDIIGGITDTLSGVAKIYDVFTRGDKQFKEDQKKWLKELIALQVEYNSVINEQIRTQDSTSVFIEDYVAQIKSAHAALDDAEFNFDETLFSGITDGKTLAKFLADIDVFVGMAEKKVHGRSVFSNMFDSLLNQYPDLIDSAGNLNTELAKTVLSLDTINDKDKAKISAAIDFQENGSQSEKNLEDYLTNLEIKTGVKKKKNWLGVTTGTKNVYGSLLENYPELIDQAGEFNDELAQTLLDLDGIPDATKTGLETLIEYQQEMEAARQQMEDSVSSMVGSLGGNIYTAISDAWDNGTDSFTAFKDTVSSGLDDITKQIAYNAIMDPLYNSLQENIIASYDEGGDQNIVDDFGKFMEAYPDAQEKLSESWKEIEEQMSDAGFDVEKTKSANSGLTGSIQNMTEETGSELAGLMRKNSDDIRITRDYAQQSVTHLAKIEQNTANTVTELRKTVSKLAVLDTIAANTKSSTSRDLGA